MSQVVIIIINYGWGSLNLPKHSIHSRSLPKWVGRGEVGITGYQPNTYRGKFGKSTESL